MTSSPTILWGIKNWTGKELQFLEDNTPKYFRGAEMWPTILSAKNSRSCLCREKGIATASIKGDVSLGVLFFFKFYCLKGKNYWATIFLHEKFLYKTLLMGGVGWVGIADATV